MHYESMTTFGTEKESEVVSKLLDKLSSESDESADKSLNDYLDRILDTEKLVLLYFWNEHCVICKFVKPILKEIQEEYPDDLIIYSIDKDTFPQMVEKFSISSFNIMIFFYKGKQLPRHMGYNPEFGLEYIFKEVFAMLE